MNALAPPATTFATGCTKPAKLDQEKLGLRPSKCESSEAYYRVIASCENYRVILCKEAIQWIIQKRVKHAGSRSGVRWKGFSYHTAQSSLIRDWHAKTALPLPPEIETLPALIIRSAN